VKAEIRNASLNALLSRTPEGRQIIKQITLSGNYDEFLGKGFWKKIGKAVKKVGKFTAPITTRIAKVAAGIIGIPPGAIDALAMVDPTAKNSLIRSIANSAAGKKASVVIKKADTLAKKAGLGNIKPAYIIAGAGALAGVVVLVALTKKR
jgi:hypothetical protein